MWVSKGQIAPPCHVQGAERLLQEVDDVLPQVQAHDALAVVRLGAHHAHGLGAPAVVLGLDVEAHVEFREVSRRFIMSEVQALSSRRFQHGFHRFSLHRPTLTTSLTCCHTGSTAPVSKFSTLRRLPTSHENPAARLRHLTPCTQLASPCSYQNVHTRSKGRTSLGVQGLGLGSLRSGGVRPTL